MAGASLVAWLSGESPERAASVRPCRLDGATAESDGEGLTGPREPGLAAYGDIDRDVLLRRLAASGF